MSPQNEFHYIPRLLDATLRKRLGEYPAVLLRGPKWCGKTTSCEQIASSVLSLRDPEVYSRSADAAAVRPSLLLRGDEPRLIDEWQLLPVLWDAVISESDARHDAPGRFILTGSATPPQKEEDKRKHTGTGRIGRITMGTMSLEETGETTGEVSLSQLFAGETQVEGISPVDIEGYSHMICRGGWPALISRGAASPTVASDYISAVCESDLEEAAGQAIDPVRAHALIRSLARVTAQEASLATILADVKDSGTGMSEPTLRTYLNALRRIYFVAEVRAWAPTLRSKTPLRTSGVWHLADPSLEAAALDANDEALLDDLTTMGFLFESLCVHDLRAYLAPMGGDVFHYRDKSGLEVDAIPRLPSGVWAGVEVKLGGEQRIEEGAQHLLTLAKKVDSSKSGSPAFLMVLTGGRYAYTRRDGVHVVPLACLKS